MTLNTFNNDKPLANEKYQMGEEVDVTVVDFNDSGFILTIPSEVKDQKTNQSKAKSDSYELKEGQLIKG